VGHAFCGAVDATTVTDITTATAVTATARASCESLCTAISAGDTRGQSRSTLPLMQRYRLRCMPRRRNPVPEERVFLPYESLEDVGILFW
jgi:hypothetical protein